MPEPPTSVSGSTPTSVHRSVPPVLGGALPANDCHLGTSVGSGCVRPRQTGDGQKERWGEEGSVGTLFVRKKRRVPIKFARSYKCVLTVSSFSPAVSPRTRSDSTSRGD